MFDTIDQQILLSRLETVFSIRSTALQWFLSYLLDRKQCVVVNNSASSSSPVMFGVPQGSVLGPVLFVLYTTPLSDIIDNHSVNHQLFADDTQLQKSTPPNDVQSLTHDLQSCTDDIKVWATTNSNLMKIKLKPFSSRHFLCPRVTAYHRQSWSVHMKFCFKTKSGA